MDFEIEKSMNIKCLQIEIKNLIEILAKITSREDFFKFTDEKIIPIVEQNRLIEIKDMNKLSKLKQLYIAKIHECISATKEWTNLL